MKTTTQTTKNILVSEPNKDGESERVCLCDIHLSAAPTAQPLGAGEYVVPTDSDIDCEECP